MFGNCVFTATILALVVVPAQRQVAARVFNYRTDDNFWPVVIDEKACDESCPSGSNGMSNMIFYKYGVRGECKCVSSDKQGRPKCSADKTVTRTSATFDTTKTKNRYNWPIIYCTQQKCDDFCSLYYDGTPGLCVQHYWRDTVACYCITDRTPILLEEMPELELRGLAYDRMTKRYDPSWFAITAEELAAIHVKSEPGEKDIFDALNPPGAIYSYQAYGVFETVWDKMSSATWPACIRVSLRYDNLDDIKLEYWSCPSAERTTLSNPGAGVYRALSLFERSPMHAKLTQKVGLIGKTRVWERTAWATHAMQDGRIYCGIFPTILTHNAEIKCTCERNGQKCYDEA